MIKENLGMKGEIDYTLCDKDGNVKDTGIIANTITNFMDKHVADQMSDQGEAQIGFIALGSGVGQTEASVDLSNYISASLIALSGLIQGTGGDDNDVIYSGFWGAGVATNPSITEAGVFQVSGTTRDSMCTYNSGLSINKGASDTLKIDWTVTFGAS